MSLVFLEGFGGYAAATHSYAAGADPKLQWSFWNNNIVLTSLSSGSQGNRKYLTCSGTDPNLVPRTKAFDSTTIVVGFRLYHQGEAGHLVRFQDGGSHLGSLLMDSIGRLQYSTQNQQNYDGHRYSTRAATPYQYSYVEVKITFHNTTGTIDFWINGTAAGSLTSQDTINNGTSCDNIIIGNSDAYTNWPSDARISDIYIDTADQHGPMDIWYQAADAAGAAANFTPLASTNHSQVDDIGSDDDTTYVSSTATTTLDQIAHSDTLNVAPLAIQPMVMARYIPTGSANIKVGVLSGTTHDQDGAVGLSDSYDGVQGKIYTTDPNTASAWTAANADAADTSYEHAA